MKRKIQEVSKFLDTPSISTRSKTAKQQLSWVSGTDIRNFLINDTLVDWLKLYSPKIRRENNFKNYIMEAGNDFEKQVVSYITKNRFPIVSISNEISPKTYTETVNSMMQGIPIIHSAPFENHKNNTKGIIDLIVRSDFLHVFADENPLPENLRNYKAPYLQGDYHYVVIDIKFSTLPLRADGKHLLNSGNYPAYKGQLRIYTEAIGEIQGYTPQYAYILGRRWVYTSKGNNYSSKNCFNKLGVVDYNDIDNDYIQKTKEAINWVRNVRLNGQNWSVIPPSREELYPNLCVDSAEWNSEKKEIADNIGDITQIWYCGIKNRKKAIEQGVNSWRDLKCNSDILGISGERGKIIDMILNINRQTKDKIRPSKLKTDISEENEIFVDFETFCDIFSDFKELPEQPKTDRIFMIGVYYKGEYKNFVVKNTSLEEEYRIMDEFMIFLKQNNFPKVWFWHAEQMLWEKAEDRQLNRVSENEEKSDNIIDNWCIKKWADLCKVFKDEPIVIKDCFKFGLKSVAEAMRKHGMISSKIESECHSGLEASVKAWKVYQVNQNPEKDPAILDITKYNKFDVKVLWEILTYLRENHI